VLASGMLNDDKALPIRASARVLAASLTAGRSAEYRIGAGRHDYLLPATLPATSTVWTSALVTAQQSRMSKP
jgi:hypothetical protein